MNAQRSAPGKPAARMVLALDALNCEAALIDAAARLAAALGADLDALFIEDDDLYAAADLPIMQEISRHSARKRELSSEKLAAALRSLSREAETRFHAAASRGRFRITRARRAEALSAACADVDLLLLVPARRAPVRVFLHVQPAPRDRIFAVCGATPASDRVLELAARLARHDRHALEVIGAGRVDEEHIDALEHAGLRVGRHRLADDATLESVLSLVENRAGNTLLVAADLPVARERARLMEQLSQLRCQSLLVN